MKLLTVGKEVICFAKGEPVATTTLTSKGQITIPIEVRNNLGLRTGDRIDLVRNAETGEYALKPRKGSIKDLFGILKYDGPPASIDDINDATEEAAVERYLHATGQTSGK